MKPVLAIDIGTSKITAGVFVNDRFLKIPFGSHGPHLPVHVAIDKQGKVILGETAKRQAISNPQHTYFSLLRFLGQNLSMQRLQDEFNRLPFRIFTSVKGDQYITTQTGVKFHYGHLLSQLIALVKKQAESFLRIACSAAILVVPPMISLNRKKAILEAVEFAKLKTVEVIDSALAAGIGYAYQTNSSQIAMLVDIGAGFIKTGIFQLKGKKNLELISSMGFEESCGDDFDSRVFDWLLGECRESAVLSGELDPVAKMRLKIASEETKRTLSVKDKALIDLPYLFTPSPSQPYHLKLPVKREQFERLAADLYAVLAMNFKQAIRAGHLLPKDINEVILTGGQSRASGIAQIFNCISKDWRVLTGDDDLVLLGAALKADHGQRPLFTMSQRSLLKLNKLPTGYSLANRFEIQKLIGEGGFSYIYKVKDRAAGRISALKILKPEFYHDESVVNRFLIAARLVQEVNHPNVVKFFELIETAGLYSVNMELLEGSTLDQFMKEQRFGRLKFVTQVEFAIGILAGMTELRAHNLYHGDLKPDNIWITPKGEAKLFDFGLARYAGGQPIVPAKVTGTPRYMSPEHLFEQSPFGDYSEIYSFGLVLYKCFTGQFPHKLSHPQQEYLIFDFSPSEAIDPGKLDAKLSRPLCDVILTCIKRRRGERYQTFEQLMQELVKVKSNAANPEH